MSRISKSAVSKMSKSSHLTLIGSLPLFLSRYWSEVWTEGYKRKEEPCYIQSVAGLQTVNI